VILTAITLVTCVSLIGRNTIGVTLVGDYELTAVAAGAAVALFLPWCQVRRENIIVDFFTARMPSRSTPGSTVRQPGAGCRHVAAGLAHHGGRHQRLQGQFPP
jgi:hypothetical protein